MSSPDLTTLDTLKNWLSTKGDFGATSDVVLQRLITACSTFIQSWLNRPSLLSADYTETYNGQGNAQIVLRNFPVTNVAAVTIDGSVIATRPPLGTGNGGGFVFDDESVMLTGYRFNRGFQNITITYTAGYPSIPADVEQAALDMLGDWFKYRDRIGTLSQALEQQTITFVNTDIPARARGVLQQYKKVVPT